MHKKKKESSSTKTESEHRGKERDKMSDEKHERSQKNFFAGVRDVRKAFLAKQPMILLVYKEATLLTNSCAKVLPSALDVLLQEF